MRREERDREEEKPDVKEIFRQGFEDAADDHAPLGIGRVMHQNPDQRAGGDRKTNRKRVEPREEQALLQRV